MLTGLDRVTDQSRRHRVDPAANPDRAPLPHHAPERRVLRDPRRRQPLQIRTLLGQPPRCPRIPRLVDDRTREPQIRRLVGEVPVAPQQQRLLEGRLRPEVRLLRDAVLVRLPRLDPRRAQPVVVQHFPEPHRQLTTAAAPQLVRRRRQVVVTKHRRHRSQRPQRALQARHQRLERLAQRQRHIRPPAVAQHTLEQQVRERHAPQRHPKVARVAEVERRFPARNRHLLEVHFALGAVLHAPLSDPPLQRPQLPGLKPTRVPAAQRPEQRQHLQPSVGVGHQLRHHLRLPHVGERVFPRPPRPCPLRRRRQLPALPLPGRPLAHPGCRRGRRQRLPCHPLLTQPPNLRVRDQPVLHEETGSVTRLAGASRAGPITSSTTGKSNCR